LLPALLTAQSEAAVLCIAIGCFVLAAIFALFENALQHHSRVRLTEEAKREDMVEAIDDALLQEDEILFATKIGRGLLQIVAVAAVVVLLVQAEVTTWSALGWSFGLAGLFLLSNVAGPYVLGRKAGHVILLRGLIPYRRLIFVVRPVASLLQRLATKMLRAGANPDPTDEITDEILSKVEEGTREGTLKASEKQMIEGVMDLREVTTEHVMTPRTEMVCLQVESSVSQAIVRAQENGHSRLPVYRDTPDDILGVLYVKDLLPYLGRGEQPPIQGILRRPFFVPQSKNVGVLLREMQAKQVHMAIVLDEYGGTAGVVTIEDILEEIVGEIADEHESRAPHDVVKITDNAATVEGRTHIDDLNDALDLEVPESEEYETVGGLLFTRLGRVPSTGEHYDLQGVRFTVLEADERRINRVKVTVHRDSA